MIRVAVAMLVMCWGFNQALAIDSKFERYTKSIPLYGTVTIDVMYMDRDGDGCYDYKIIWLNGDYFHDGTLLKAGGAGVAPTEWTSTGKLRDFSIASCSGSPDVITLEVKDTITSSTIATMSQSCGSTSHVWSSYSPLLVTSAHEANTAGVQYVLYPNPVTGRTLNVGIDNSSNILSAMLMDVEGRSWSVGVGQGARQTSTIDVGSAPSGIYYLLLSLGNGQTVSIPFTRTQQ